MILASVEHIDVKRICQAIHAKYNIQLNNFSSVALRLRIAEFYKKNSITDLDQFITKIESSEVFCNDFLKELIVPNNEIFRDPSLWRKLRDEIIPALASNGILKIAIIEAGLGDDLISLLIVLQEKNLLAKTKITVTNSLGNPKLNITENVLNSKSIESNLSNYKRYNEKGIFPDIYSQQKDGNFTYKSELFTSVEFKKFNPSFDALPNRFDIVFFRNSLLVINQSHHTDTLKNVASLLTKGGLLVMGIGDSKKSLADSTSDFNVYNEHERIYKKIV